ncbi:porin OmpA [Spirabiliibacterium falconis]|uniref:porin OmpA n=1 Tax=Spirabiliibacterium falconis TaxID=572023 RepID=UPI001AAC93F9|nr:porin OmpA [Spirabiliibacterium falconis]MBE2893989.1 porin OmpA [Spirabiliibacterium falconis]
MKKTAIALAISGFALASVAQAAPQANTFYTGVKAGWAKYHDGVKVGSNVVNEGQYDKTRRNSVTYGVYGGYQISPNFAAELGYDYYGSYELKSPGADKFKHTAHGANLSLKASYPIVTDLDFYAKVGAALVHSNYKFTGKVAEKKHSNRVSALFAGGLEYAITPSLAFNVEYQWLNNVGKLKLDEKTVDYRPDIGSVTAGLTYRFGQSVQAPEIVTKKFAFSSDVLFAFDKADLKPTAAQAIDTMTAEVAQSGLNNPNFNVAGYTDRLGSDAYNLKLSQKRAETVANYLVSKGVPQTNVSAVGYGKANPVTGSNCDAVKGRKALIACLAPDRRVEVAVQGAKTFKM